MGQECDDDIAAWGLLRRQAMHRTEPMPFSQYPASITEVLNPPVRFRAATIQAVEFFARSDPWTGPIGERMDKFEKVHQDLCSIYGKETRLRFGLLDGSCSGSSYYQPSASSPQHMPL